MKAQYFSTLWSLLPAVLPGVILLLIFTFTSREIFLWLSGLYFVLITAAGMLAIPLFNTFKQKA